MAPSASNSRKNSWPDCAALPRPSLPRAPVKGPPARANLPSAPLYSRPMKLLAALALLIALVSLPGAQAQTAASPTIYTVEIIVFRNLSGAGGPEDWSAKPVARGPDTPDTTVTGRFVQSLPASQFQLNDIAARLQNT